MLNYRWKFRRRHDEETVQDLAKNLKIPKSLANVLSARGMKSEVDAQLFFSPSLDKIHDPFLMEDMDKAVDRIIQAVNNKELIWVHGDYDVDGASSIAIVTLFLQEIGGRVEYYLPDRFEEGYGLSLKSMNLAKERDAKILITVDLGITAYAKLDYARSMGFDTIICDHHEPGDTLPDVYAILDPLKATCNYPFKHLSASGVAFKLIQAISIRLNIPDKALEFLDFVAVASIADMVPLIGENRIMVHHGLELLNSKTRPGIKGLLHCTSLKPGMISSTNIVYAVAPLINAAGRLGDARRSVDMLIQKDEIAAFRIAQELEDENRKRRLYDMQTFEETIPIAEEYLKSGKARSLVLHAPHWHAGVIGIVASRLVDRFNLPSILLTSIDGVAKGSARSINSFDIYAALKKNEELLLEFGGHRHACGLTIEESNIAELRRRFDEIACSQITQEMLIPEIEIDTELKLNELSPNFFNTLNLFSPFGYSNYKPIFFTKGVKSINGVKIIGNNTLKFRAIQNNFVIDAIAQNLAHKIHLCTGGKKFAIVYNLELNNYNGQTTPQLSIKDIQPDDHIPS